MSKKTAFILQGGGALGAYQAGACHYLFEKNIHPDWLVGISIGALNTAIIAGNKPENRLQALINFWMYISSQNSMTESISQFNNILPDSMKKVLSGINSNNTIIQGQPGFFKPNKSAFNPLGKFIAKSLDELSYYNTKELKETLLKFADFDLINSGLIRVSIGVVKVESGEFKYFDNTKEILTPEHFMASGALPPSFPAVEIDGDYYWDGGIYDNTAIRKLLMEDLDCDWLAYQIDLWRNEHDIPTDFDDVNQRLRDIQFSSRNKEIDSILDYRKQQKNDLSFLIKNLPEEVKKTKEYLNINKQITRGEIEIKRIIYKGMSHETRDRPYQFSSSSIKDHWENGFEDMKSLLL